MCSHGSCGHHLVTVTQCNGCFLAAPFFECLKFLVETFKCDPSVRAKDGRLPIHMVCPLELGPAGRLLSTRNAERGKQTSSNFSISACRMFFYGSSQRMYCVFVCVVWFHIVVHPQAAATRGAGDSIRYLIKLDPSNLEAEDNLKARPLVLSCWQNNKDGAALLLALKADPNARTSVGATAMHLATRYSTADTMKLLVAAKADPQAQMTDGSKGERMALYREGRRRVSIMAFFPFDFCSLKNIQNSLFCFSFCLWRWLFRLFSDAGCFGSAVPVGGAAALSVVAWRGH
jgi:hypothetical protein